MRVDFLKSAVIFFFLNFFLFANGQTLVEGEISVNTAWTDTGNPYILINDVTVREGVNLTIEKGVIVKLINSETDLHVYGSLQINGQTENPVIFTSYSDDSYGGDSNRDSDQTFPEVGDWGAVILHFPGKDNVFKNACFYYGGSDSPEAMIYNESLGLKLDSCDLFQSANNGIFSKRSVTIQNCNFKENSSNGIYLDLSNASAEVNLISNKFLANKDYPIATYLLGTNVTLTSKGNYSAGSFVNGIFSKSNNLGNLVFYGDSLLPLIVKEGIIPKSTIFDVKADSRIYFYDLLSGIEVNGTLKAIGKYSKPVIFSSLNELEDDLDEKSLLTSARGDWNSIQFSSTSVNNIFKNVEIRNGGNYSSSMVSVDQAQISIDSCLFSNSSSSGIEVSGMNIEINHSSIQENNGDGLTITGFNSVNLKNNHFSLNAENGIKVGEGTYLQLDSCYFSNNKKNGIFWNSERLGCKINNCDFESNLLDGIYLFGSYTVNKPEFIDNNFTNNRYPIQANISRINHDIILNNNTGIGNYRNGLFLNGSIAGNISLHHQDDFPFIIGDFSVAETGVLNLLPGTILKFEESYYGMMMLGSIVARGNAVDPVIFTSIDDDSAGGDTNNNGESTPEQWDWRINIVKNAGNIEFENCLFKYGSGIEATSDNVEITNCTFENFQNTAVTCNNCSPSIHNNKFFDIPGYAIQYYRNKNIRLKNNYFENCTLPFMLELDSINSDIHYNNDGNVFGGSGVHGFGIEGNIVGDITLVQNNDFPMVICGLNVQSSGKLTLPGGSIFKVLENDIYVYGKLEIEGTEENPVVITSIKDDAHGGDTNNDGDASEPRPGDWGVLFFHSTFNSNISYLWLGYGGKSTRRDIGLLSLYETSVRWNNIKMKIDNCVITHSANHGIWLEYESTPDITNCRIINNRNDGINTHQSKPTLTDNEIAGNGRYGVNNEYTLYDIDARQNHWGDGSGPYHPTKNPNGKGNEVSDYVLFLPFWQNPLEFWITDAKEIQLSENKFEIFPVPTSGELTFSFHLAGNSNVKLKLFSSDGKLYDTILDEYRNSGETILKYSTAKMNPGIYFAEILVNGGRQVKKLIVSR
ncbi:MAG: right-handed parallel beta-helix repeat-containing protein [Prolixibacteraceae bacterium]|nr:right-handed parallel beta-helix repeat-containing protein [Prolixibacteraceae bacterium]